MKATKTARLAGLFLFLLFWSSGGGLSAAKKAATTGVPGVDKLPAARYLHTEPEKKPKKQGKKQEDSQTKPSAQKEESQPEEASEEDKPKLELPLITNLQIKPDSTRLYSVRLDWDVSPANDTVIYVARYVRPLESRELLFDADLASLRPLPPQTRSFLDYNIPDGTYYYAVVTAYEMSAKNRLVLKPGVNYVTNPMVIYRKKKTPTLVKSSGLYQVRGLYAVNTKDSVVLSWTPAKASNILYNIYKSYQPLVEAADLEFAQKLSVVDGNTLKYKDTAAIENRKTWYAVTVTDKTSAQEYRKLVANENIVQNIFTRVKMDDDRLALLPSALTPFLESGNSIKLFWSDPQKHVPELAVFRSHRPITSVSALRQATHVGTVAYGVQQFRDSSLSPGVYFYALLPKKDERKLVGIFVAGRSFTSFGIRVFPKQSKKEEVKKETKTTKENKENTNTKKESAIKIELRYLRAKAVRKDSILVRWKLKKKELSEEDLEELQFLLYRSTQKVKRLDDLEEKAEFLEEIDAETEEYLDEGLKPGKYYYALVVDYKGELQEKLKAGKNYLRRPVYLKEQQAKEKETTKIKTITKIIKKDAKPFPSPYTLEGLNRILARTYHRRRFGSAIRQIAPFVYSKGVKPSVQSRALFYTGLSYYGLRRYKAALEFFVDDRVRRFYPERSRFWYNRSIEKIGGQPR